MNPALAWKSKPPPGCGSGKLDTPLARMHLANASAPGGPALDPVVVAAPALDAVEPTVLALPTVAPVGLVELPPHPATSTPLTSAAAVSRRARAE